jgi:hypothetical protein
MGVAILAKKMLNEIDFWSRTKGKLTVPWKPFPTTPHKLPTTSGVGGALEASKCLTLATCAPPCLLKCEPHEYSWLTRMLDWSRYWDWFSGLSVTCPLVSKQSNGYSMSLPEELSIFGYSSWTKRYYLRTVGQCLVAPNQGRQQVTLYTCSRSAGLCSASQAWIPHWTVWYMRYLWQSKVTVVLVVTIHCVTQRV